MSDTHRDKRVLSMTGFGAGEAPLGPGTVRIELRAVNHRHLDVRVRASSELADASGVIEEVIRATCSRGRIEAQVRWDAPNSGSGLDLERARTAYQLLVRLRDELAPGEAVPLTAILSVPGLFGATTRFQGAELEGALKLATTRAAGELAAMRAREGEALSTDMLARLRLLRAHTEWVESQRPNVVDATRQRLLKRIEKLLEGTGVEVDAARVTQEVAWFADKSDVAEEVTRLLSHLAEFERSLLTGESVGRKLDFLVQELGREVNTIGSKANDAEISHRVVEMKAELERIREQVQNIL